MLPDEAQLRALRDAHPALSPARALRHLTARWLGAHPHLVMHGAGNTSLKERGQDGRWTLWIKASGRDLGSLAVDEHLPVDLDLARALLAREDLCDRALAAALALPGRPAPSLETLMHAQIEAPWVDHTHPEAVLSIVNGPDGAEQIAALLGPGTAVVPYARPGLALSRAVQRALRPGVRRLVLRHHGLVTWGEQPEDSLRDTLRAVRLAEGLLRPLSPSPAGPDPAQGWGQLRPYLERLLPGDALAWGASEEDLALAAAGVTDGASPTTDHLARTRPWLLDGADPARPGTSASPEQLAGALARWTARYQAYLDHHLPPGIHPFPARPRVITLPGVGLVGAGGSDREAAVALDLGRSALRVRARAPHPLVDLDLGELIAMEYPDA